MMLRHTNHSKLRSVHRCLSDEDIEYVYEYGTRIHSGGALVYYLRDRDIPLQDQRFDWAVRLAGTALVVSRDSRTLLTVWRNRQNGLKIIKRKTH